MPLVLGIETSGATGSLALLRDEVVIASVESAVRNAHGEALLPLLAALLKDAGVTVRDLAAIGVGVGPGSFTGVRVALGTALGLRLATGVPIVAVDAFDATLEAARAEGVAPRRFAVLLDALREEAFVRVTTEEGDQTPVILPFSALNEEWSHGLERVFGTVVDRVPSAVAKVHAAPTAAAIARLAARRPPTDVPEPLYLRPPDISVAKPKRVGGA